MRAFLSYFESGRLGDYLKAKATKLYRWAAGTKPKVNPALRQRLQERLQEVRERSESA